MQLDSALALRYSIEDKDFMLMLAHQMLEGMAMVAKSNRAKVKIGKFKSIIDKMRESDPDYVPSLEEALATLGGRAGTIVRKG